jgi:acyl-CoA thioesterase-2
MGDVLDSILGAIDMKDLGDDRYAGPNVELGDYFRIFGGQLLAQAIEATAVTVPEKEPRSLHLVFASEGKPGVPIEWQVGRSHEGRSFATRTVSAYQGERLLCTGAASLTGSEEGIAHQDDMPDVERPEDLPENPPSGAFPCEMRVCGGVDLSGNRTGPPELAVWMKLARPVRGPLRLQQELLACCSDGTMMSAAILPHEGVGWGSPRVKASAVTTHTISFHQPFVFDDWMLFVQHSPASHAGRAYIRGDWFTAAGALVASCAQEVLIRTVPA